MSLTERINTKVKIDNLLKLKGAYDEDRMYHIVNGEQFFGNYPLAKWESFKSDLITNGLKYPISLWVENGEIVIAEGNHRIKAFQQLGIAEIETEISFFYGSENEVDYKTILGI